MGVKVGCNKLDSPRHFIALIICGCVSKECYLHLEKLVWMVNSHCKKAKWSSCLRAPLPKLLQNMLFILPGIRIDKD